MNEITIVEVQGHLVVDSRIIAEQLGIKHQNFLENIRKHLSVLEANFGGVTFETAPDSAVFTYMNEAQSTFVMTLSRNSPKVIKCKVGLVKAFTIYKQLQQSKNYQQPVTPVATTPLLLPPITTRKQINKLVNDYSFFTGFQHERVWRKIYTALNDHYAYDIFHKKEKGNKLDRIETDGQIDNLLTVAKQYLEIPANILTN